MVYLAIGHDNEGGYAPNTTRFVVGFTTEKRKYAFVDALEERYCVEREKARHDEDYRLMKIDAVIESLSDMYDEFYSIDKMDFYFEW